MFQKQHISRTQKRGIIVHIPNGNFPETIHDYRTIILLSTDYKLMARVLAGRLQLAFAEHLRGTQLYGVTDASILDALAFVSDVIA
jgi:hypothetical protein